MVDSLHPGRRTRRTGPQQASLHWGSETVSGTNGMKISQGAKRGSETVSGTFLRDSGGRMLVGCCVAAMFLARAGRLPLVGYLRFAGSEFTGRGWRGVGRIGAWTSLGRRWARAILRVCERVWVVCHATAGAGGDARPARAEIVVAGDGVGFFIIEVECTRDV